MRQSLLKNFDSRLTIKYKLLPCAVVFLFGELFNKTIATYLDVLYFLRALCLIFFRVDTFEEHQLLESVVGLPNLRV